MSEPSRNSLKLDIVGSGGRTGGGDSEVREIYKSIPEDDRIADSRNDLSKEHKKSPKMVHNGENVPDGADEKMLKDEDKINLAKKDEVQFISGNQNGDAKIDIGTVDRVFTGMTKDELMKYANDPFWVRLRWIFFIGFWALWVAMLVGAILIIINAPRCAAPTPLVWWKQGPLVNFKSAEYSEGDKIRAEKLKATGVIYELPGAHTYIVKNADVENKIKKLVEQYNGTNIKVILDLTPNYVTNESAFFKEALRDEGRRTSFIWAQQPLKPSNWVAKPPLKRSAWESVQTDNWVLSTFGDGLYDLQMNDPLVKRELRKTLEHLTTLGVKGFRLANAKHFIVDKSFRDEVPVNEAGQATDWQFWTHGQTTFQDGLGTLLHEFTLIVHNATDNDGFLSVTEDLVRPETFKTDYGNFGIDLPFYGRFPYILAKQPEPAKKNYLYKELKDIMDTTANTTVQWNYNTEKIVSLNPSAYNIFFMLLPGVPIQSADSVLLTNVSASSIEHLANLRQSSSYMHGLFNIYDSDDLIAYSSIKSGNPGFFVVLNPTGLQRIGNFTGNGLPEKMTVDLLSDNYNVTDIAPKSKVSTDSILVSPYSAAVLTYVPVKN